MQATRDDVAFLFHDARLERTTDGYGIAADKTARELDRLDAGRWFAPKFRGEKVPRFDAALALLDELDMGAVIEVKAEPGDGTRTMRATLAVLRRMACERHILSSFDEDALALAAADMPGLARALIVKAIPGDWRTRVAQLGCGALHAGERGLTAEIVGEIAGQCTLRAYTVNKPERAGLLLAWGAAAVFTDCPDVIKSALEHRAEGPRGSRGSEAQ